MSFKTQSSILYHFNNSYSIAIIDRFLIHYPLEKKLQRRIYFQCFLLWKWFYKNLVSLEVTNFYSLFWINIAALWVSLIKINSTYKTQSSRQKIVVNINAWNNLCIEPFLLLFWVVYFVYFMLRKCYWILIIFLIKPSLAL